MRVTDDVGRRVRNGLPAAIHPDVTAELDALIDALAFASEPKTRRPEQVWLTVNDVQVLLKVTSQTVRSWARSGRLTGRKVSERLWLIRRDENLTRGINRTEGTA